ncbi:MAG: glycine cleavage system protein H, partial [Deltaproteobacteria bacterium]|nr:glycine cleavage system protein H [Deltaproteobacteria bacterium]
EDSPGLVNTSPHTDGWIIRIKQSDPDQLDILMNRKTYLKMLEGVA